MPTKIDETMEMLHAQRRLDVAFIADAVRQLNDAEASQAEDISALREYLDRAILRLQQRVCPGGCIQGMMTDGFLDAPCHICNGGLE